MQSCLDVDPNRGFISLVQRVEVSFDVEDGVRWFPYKFNNSLVLGEPAYDGVS